MSNLIKIDAAGNRLPFEAGEWVAVLDESTGLMWPKDDSGERLDDKGEAKYIAGLNESALAGFSDWRICTRPELLTIVDLDRYEPAINKDFFPGTKSAWYRTSSPCAWAPASGVWFVYFGLGDVYVSHRDGLAFVRAVRVAGAPARQ